MDRFLNPSLVVVIALIISALMTFVSKGEVDWQKLATDSITYYFVYMRGKDDNGSK